MGFFFGSNAGTPSYKATAELAQKIQRKGGGNSPGATELLRLMTAGRDPEQLNPAEAAQAAQSLRQVAPRLRGTDRGHVERIAADAEEAARSNRPWTVG
ncbi:DUF7739 domain-containing protein [Streptosporangium roseum]|uniref:DUF7739 domain-containing protein n=1 Tax=Streptosporangium roseum TaxID=2001 RepID=UPI0033236A01